jgi:hypothetical protein
MKGVEFTMGEREFDAWAVKNTSDDKAVYSLR